MKRTLYFFMLPVMFVFFNITPVHADTHTWTGTTSSDWQVGTNWTPAGPPAAGDIVRFDQTGANRNITNVPTRNFLQIIVATTGVAVSYSFTAPAATTLTLQTGAAGTDLSIAANCELIVYSNVTLTITGGLTALIAGNLVMEGTLNDNTTGNFVVNGSVHMNSAIATNGNRTISGTGTFYVDAGKTLTITNTAGTHLILSTSNIINDGAISISNNGEFRPNPGSAMTSSATSTMTLTGNAILRSNGTVSIASVTSAATSVFRDESGTMTLTGTSGISGTLRTQDLLIIDGDVTVNTGGIVTHSAGGTININSTRTFTANVSFISGNNTTMIVNGTFSIGTGNTWTCQGTSTVTIGTTGNITGAGNMTHTAGTCTVNGLVTIGGNFRNAAGLTGTGTIEIGGLYNNTSTMFGYTGNPTSLTPPGQIVSGYTWHGTASNAWGNASNWWGNLVPVSTGDAVIYSGTNQPTLSTAGQNCRRLYIHSDASVLTIAPAGQLTASGKTTLGGGGGGAANHLLIRSDGTGTGSFIDNGTIDGSGAATMERYLAYGATGRWHYICIPMATINAWTYKYLYMKYYNEPLHRFRYVIASGSDSILNSDGLGYAMWATSNWTISQAGIPNTGTINIPVTRTLDISTSDYDGWNLVGNPYPSSIDVSLLTASWTNVEQTTWCWDPVAGVYKVYPSGGGGSHTKYIPPEQGFFVHNYTGSSGTVVMNNAARVHNTESFLKESEDPLNILRIKAEGTINSYYDELSVYFNDALTGGYDPGFDAEKIDGEVTAPEIYTTIPDYKLAVNAMPFSQSEMVIPMAFKVNLAGTYTLTASSIESFQPDVTIQLEDMQEGIIQDLRTNPVYSFSHVMTNDPNRFLLHFGDPNLGTHDITNSGNAVDVYSYSDRVYVRINGTGEISGNIFVYDIIGRKVYQDRLSGSHLQEFGLSGYHGYYIVKVISNQGTETRKIFL